MKPALWPTELSRRGWPPRDRTALYLRIRQAPSTSWVAASGCGRSRTCKAEARPGSGRVPSPGRIAHPRAERRESNSQGRSSAAFGAGPRHQSGCLSMAEDGVIETHPRMGPLAFRAVTAPWRLHPPWRRAENSNPTALPAHPVSSEARHPGRFTLRTLPGIRTRTSSS